MPEDTQTGTPAASDQQPQRGADGTITVPASDQGSADGQQPNSDTVRDPIAKAVADAEAKYRTQLRQAEKKIADFEAEKQARDEAQLSELEKVQKRLAESQTSSAEKERQFQERIIRAELRIQASALGVNSELAARLVDYAAIEYDENGDPTNIAALLGTAISTYQLNVTPATPLAQQPASASQQQQPPATPNPGATNPVSPKGGMPTISAAQYYDQQFIATFRAQYGMTPEKAVLSGKANLV